MYVVTVAREHLSTTPLQSPLLLSTATSYTLGRALRYSPLVRPLALVLSTFFIMHVVVPGCISDKALRLAYAGTSRTTNLVFVPVEQGLGEEELAVFEGEVDVGV